jgi:hypothetical protein
MREMTEFSRILGAHPHKVYRSLGFIESFGARVHFISVSDMPMSEKKLYGLELRTWRTCGSLSVEKKISLNLISILNSHSGRN